MIFLNKMQEVFCKERIPLMEERFIAFIIWGIIGLLFIVMGIYEFHSKKAKPFGFWANAEVAPIEDVKGYNSALGAMLISIAAIATYVVGIERKYRKKK